MFAIFSKSAVVCPDTEVNGSEKELDVTITNSLKLRDYEPAKYPIVFDAASDRTVLYQGSRTFWRSRLTLSVAVVEHSKADCIEIITDNAKAACAGPRLYVTKSVLNERFTDKEVEKYAKKEKEACLRSKRSFDWNQLLLETKYRLIVQFLLSRLTVNRLEGENFSVSLTPSFSDRLNPLTNSLDVLCEKPEHLEPFPMEHSTVTSFETMKQTMEDVREDTKDVGKSFAAVHQLLSHTRSVLGGQDATAAPKRRTSLDFLSRYRRQVATRVPVLENPVKTSAIGAILQGVREFMTNEEKKASKGKSKVKKIPTVKVFHEEEEATKTVTLMEPVTMNSLENSPRVDSPPLENESHLQRLASVTHLTGETATSPSKKKKPLKRQNSSHRDLLKKQKSSSSLKRPMSPSSTTSSKEENVTLALSRQLSKQIIHDPHH